MEVDRKSAGTKALMSLGSASISAWTSASLVGSSGGTGSSSNVNSGMGYSSSDGLMCCSGVMVPVNGHVCRCNRLESLGDVATNDPVREEC